MSARRARIGAAKTGGAAETGGAGRRQKPATSAILPDSPIYGYYARLFREAEMQDLPASLESGVQDEAAMLKVLIRRVFELTAGSEDTAESIRTLQALGQAATRLAGLLETQQEISPQEDRVMSELSLALDEVLKGWGRK